MFQRPPVRHSTLSTRVTLACRNAHYAHPKLFMRLAHNSHPPSAYDPPPAGAGAGQAVRVVSPAVMWTARLCFGLLCALPLVLIILRVVGVHELWDQWQQAGVLKVPLTSLTMPWKALSVLFFGVCEAADSSDKLLMWLPLLRPAVEEFAHWVELEESVPLLAPTYGAVSRFWQRSKKVVWLLLVFTRRAFLALLPSLIVSAIGAVAACTTVPVGRTLQVSLSITAVAHAPDVVAKACKWATYICHFREAHDGVTSSVGSFASLITKGGQAAGVAERVEAAGAPAAGAAEGEEARAASVVGATKQVEAGGVPAAGATKGALPWGAEATTVALTGERDGAGQQ
jgi:hypothetical protein